MPAPNLNLPPSVKSPSDGPASIAPAPVEGASPTETVLPEDLRAAFKSAPNYEEKVTILRCHFELKAVGDAADLPPGVLCALRRDAELYLVEIGPLKDDQRTVDLRLHSSARHAKPALLSALVELGRKGSLHRLEPKAFEPTSQCPALSQEIASSATGSETTSQCEGDSLITGAHQIDLTSFTRLISLAQSCGMVPNVDNIAAVRDAEFRAGQYLTAYYNIERMYTALKTAAQQRQQQLRREDIAYRSGKLRMSPREWNQKLARDTAKTQSIERALSQFRNVMAGLRLRALAAQQAGGASDPGA